MRANEVCVFGPGFFEGDQVGVGVFPSGEQILVGGALVPLVEDADAAEICELEPAPADWPTLPDPEEALAGPLLDADDCGKEPAVAGSEAMAMEPELRAESSSRLRRFRSLRRSAADW
jgi:hypothetical protein